MIDSDCQRTEEIIQKHNRTLDSNTLGLQKHSHKEEQVKNAGWALNVLQISLLGILNYKLFSI